MAYCLWRDLGTWHLPWGRGGEFQWWDKRKLEESWWECQKWKKKFSWQMPKTSPKKAHNLHWISRWKIMLLIYSNSFLVYEQLIYKNIDSTSLHKWLIIFWEKNRFPVSAGVALSQLAVSWSLDYWIALFFKTATSPSLTCKWGPTESTRKWEEYVSENFLDGLWKRNRLST